MTDGFKVKLTRSETEVFVPAGSTILFTLLDAGIHVPFSCGSGMCGTCETDVLSGVPDHRDFILSEDERASNEVMMICCSLAKTSELELDL